jgi:hypothetical protein
MDGRGSNRSIYIDSRQCPKNVFSRALGVSKPVPTFRALSAVDARSNRGQKAHHAASVESERQQEVAIRGGCPSGQCGVICLTGNLDVARGTVENDHH